MVLRMARPTSRNGSSNVYFRVRIPADVKAVARGQSLAIPVGDIVFPVALSKAANEVKPKFNTIKIKPMYSQCVAGA